MTWASLEGFPRKSLGRRNMRKIGRLCRIAILILMGNGYSALATVYQSDGSAASVQGLQNVAQDGDTITLPAGTFVWTTKINVTKAITIQGETTAAGDHTTFHNAPMTANDQTVIVDRNASRVGL